MQASGKFYSSGQTPVVQEMHAHGLRLPVFFCSVVVLCILPCGMLASRTATGIRGGPLGGQGCCGWLARLASRAWWQCSAACGGSENAACPPGGVARLLALCREGFAVALPQHQVGCGQQASGLLWCTSLFSWSIMILLPAAAGYNVGHLGLSGVQSRGFQSLYSLQYTPSTQ